jgi:hypothetical protein
MLVVGASSVQIAGQLLLGIGQWYQSGLTE